MNGSIVRSSCRIAFYGLCFMLAGCAAQTNATSERWQQEWNNRAQRYDMELASLQDDLSEQWSEFQTILVSQPVDQDALSAKLTGLGETVFLISKTEAQATVLSGYRDHLKTEPTYGIVSNWIAERAQQVLELDERYRSRLAAYQAKYSGPSADYANWLDDTEALVRQRGAITGAGDEVIRLSREFQLYEQEMHLAAQADEAQRLRVAAALQAMGQSMQQYSYQQQMLYQMQRPRTCIPNGVSVTCY